MDNFILLVWGAKDVIKPMEVDIVSAWEAGQRSLRNSTTAIAMNIAQQIETQFPQSQAHLALSNIEYIVPHMNPLMSNYLSGLPVRVPGIIDGGSSSDSGSTNASISPKDLDDLRERYEKLLKTERYQSNTKQIALEGNLKNAQNQITILQTTIQGLQGVDRQRLDVEARLRTATQQLQDKDNQLQGVRNERDALLEQKETLEIQLQFATKRVSELEQRVIQAGQQGKYISSLEEELETLRDKHSKAASDIAYLTKKLKDQEDLIASLRRGGGHGSEGINPPPGWL